MIKGNIALLLLAALAAEPGVSDTSRVAAIKQMCDRRVVGQGRMAIGLSLAVIARRMPSLLVHELDQTLSL